MSTSNGKRSFLADEEQYSRFMEFEQIVRAITRDEVDAFVVSSGTSDHVLTLASNDQPYRLLVENMQQGGVTLSAGGLVYYVNQQFARMLNADAAEIIGQSFFDFISDDARPKVTQLIQAITTERQEIETCLRQKNGGLIPALASVVLDENSSAIFLIVTDLTEAKRQQALHAEEALSASILEQAVDAVLVCDLHGNILRASHAARDLCECEPVGVLFDAAFNLHGPGGALDYKALARGNTLRSAEYRLSLGQDVVTVLLSAGPVLDRQGNVLGIVVTMTDIEDRKRAENALREAHDELAVKVVERTAELTNLSHHLIDVAEEERASVARELHDDMGGILTALSMQLSQLNGLIHSSPSQAAELTRGALQLVKDIADSQRRIVNNLRPVMLDTFGLNETVRHYVETWRKHTGIATVVETPAAPIPLGATESLAMFRVLQESLTNVAKHARAASVSVALVVDEWRVTMTIEDDGVGIARELLQKPTSHGIVGMRERLSSVGGTLIVTSCDGRQGTRVDAWISRTGQATAAS